METIETSGKSSPPSSRPLQGEGVSESAAAHGEGMAMARQAPLLHPQSTGVIEEHWVSPGVSVRKRLLTGSGVVLAAAVFFAIARWQGAGMLVSTVIGVVFIGCFVWYLTIVAPRPFTLVLDDAGITRTDAGAAPQTIPWAGLAKIKAEVFKSGKSVSLTVYKRVGERGLHRAWVVYRDDVPRFDELLAAIHVALPEGVPWICETVHE